jgi:dihydroorotate dehydrogenase
LLIKLAPDVDDDELLERLNCLLSHEADGVILSNTTVACDHLQDKNQHQKGGVSGVPLKRLADHCLGLARDCVGDKLVIIASGGVMCAADVIDKFSLGASLTQLYTGLVFQGPELVYDILARLQKESS